MEKELTFHEYIGYRKVLKMSSAPPIRPNRFEISLKGSVFLPGDTIKGVLHVETNKDITCRALRIRMRGEGHSYFVTGSGKHRKLRTGSKVYVNSRKDLWGHMYKTQVLDNAGTTAVFGCPWDPTEGHLHMTLHKDQRFVIVRVMDYDWGVKDDLLGEYCIDINDCVGKGVLEVALQRKGKVEKGTVTFSVEWDSNIISQADSPDARRVLLKVFRACNLRSADWGGKNDVYIQAYAVPVGQTVKEGHAMPEPLTKAVFPPTSCEFPFEFTLPYDLPSSECISGGNHVVYSLYANFDVPYKYDLSTRVFFHVIAPVAAAMYMQPQTSVVSKVLHRQLLGCIPLSCFAPIGQLQCVITSDRSAYAPGEVAYVSFDFGNSTASSEVQSRVVSYSLTLFKVASLWAESHERTVPQQVAEVITHVSSDTQVAAAAAGGANMFRMSMAIPPLPPAFRGRPDDTKWMSMVKSYGGNRYGMGHPDPLTWSYQLRASITIDAGGCFGPSVYSVYLPINIASLGLGLFPANSSVVQVRVVSSPMTTVLPSSSLSSSQVLPENQSNNASLTDKAPLWSTVPEIVSALPKLRACSVNPAIMENGPVVVLHSQEDADHRQDKARFQYTPQYFVNLPQPVPPTAYGDGTVEAPYTATY